MRTSKRWTKDEEQVLLSHIENNPNNFVAAFKAAAEELEGRTVKSVQQHWYTNLQKTNKVFIACTSKKRLPINKKSSKETFPIKKSKWRRILEILFEK